MTNRLFIIDSFNMANSKEVAGFLIIFHPPEHAARIPFYYGTNIVGRTQAKASIVIKEISVSQKHASLVAYPGKVVLIDLGSKNGTKINGDTNFVDKNKEVTIDESMVIHFAEVRCKIELTPPKGQQQKVKNRAEIMKMFEDEPQGDAFPEKPKMDNFLSKPLKDQFQKPIVKEEFDLKEGFQDNKLKEVKPEKKKQSKKNKSLESKQNDHNNDDKKNKPKDPVKKSKYEKGKKEGEGPGNPQLQREEVKKQKSVKVQEQPVRVEEKKQKTVRVEEKKEKPVRVEEKKQNRKVSPIRLKVPSPPRQEKRRQSPRHTKVGEKPQKSRSKDEKEVTEVSIEKEEKKKGKSKNIKNKSVSPSPKRQKSGPDNQGKPKSRVSKGKPKEVKNEDSPNSRDTNIDRLSSMTKRKMNRKRMPSISGRQIKLESGQLMIHPRRSFVGKRILCSNFIPQLKRKYFYIVENPNEQFDYLVMKEYKRTFKALLAICRGIPIVNFEWVQQSQNFEKIMRHEYYIFKSMSYIYDSIEKTSKGNTIFKGFDFYMASKSYHMKAQQIETLISISGGIVLAKLSKELSKGKKETSVALVMNKDRNNEKQLETDVKNAKKHGFEKIYTIEFLLDSCERQSIDWLKNEASKFGL